MTMKTIEKLKLHIFGVDPETFIAYRTAIPSSIDLSIDTIGDSFVATIKSIDKKNLPAGEFLITEAHSQDELINMVNDLIFSYKEIPEAYRPYYKGTLRPHGSIKKTKNLELVKAG